MKLETRKPVRFKSFARPTTPAHPNCFLVYYDGGLSSLAALREACRQAKPDTKIIAVYLEMIPFTQEPGSDGTRPTMETQGILAAAIVNAATYGVSIKTTHQECHVRGPALLGLAAHYSNAKIFLGIEKIETDDDPFASYIQALAPERAVLVSTDFVV